ncbi:MAG: peptidoglycan bridge formation glycyltransferase FemA/FemB family protein [Solobacterium sp.]|nr:peptidoglycan bridge formation glycyltransferase FemA/FemB family protein [Solobacterium sp.]
MPYTFHTDTDPKRFREFVLNSDQNTLFQNPEWALVKEDSWNSIIASVTENGEMVAAALILIRPIVFGKTMFYIPRGPVMDWHNQSLVTFMLDHLKELARKNHAMVLRFDPYVIYRQYDIKEKDQEHPAQNEDVIAFLKQYGAEHKGFTKRIEEATQPRYNIIMKVDDSWKDRLIKNTRQSIRTAEKRGAECFEGPEYIPDLRTALHFTETRQGIVLRSEAYFRRMAEVYKDHCIVMIAKLNFAREAERLNRDLSETEEQLAKAQSKKETARLEKQIENDRAELERIEEYRKNESGDEVVLCGKMVIFNEKRMEFVYMGNNTNYMRVRANYWLYSKCLERCQELGIEVCSFGGVEGTLDDGLTQFKSAWPVEVEEMIGEFNIVLDPLLYRIFTDVYPLLLKTAAKLRSKH